MKPTPARTVAADLLVLSGVGLVVAGLWLIYPPVAMIAAGVILAVIGTRVAA